MHSNLRLEVPESVLSDGIFKDNKPLSAISLKTLLFLMYYFDGNCEDKVTVPLSDLCFMFGHDSAAITARIMPDALFPIWNGLLINHSHSAVITIWSV